MKKNAIFEQCLANVDPEIKQEVDLNIDIANRIYDLLKAKNITQREFATRMGKRESEISRWLTGAHGFTISTLAKIAVVLGEPIIEVPHKQDKPEYVFVPFYKYVKPSDAENATYTSLNNNHCSFNYIN